MKKLMLFFTLACSLLLSGCATTFSSQVSVFHEWPAATQDKSFIFERAPGQENNPEHKLYEDMLRSRLQNLGFKEVMSGATPLLKVELQYATTLREIQYSPFWLPGIYDPYWSLHFQSWHLSPSFYVLFTVLGATSLPQRLVRYQHAQHLFAPVANPHY